MVGRAGAAKSIVRFLSCRSERRLARFVVDRRNFHYTVCVSIMNQRNYGIGILIRLEARGCD